MRSARRIGDERRGPAVLGSALTRWAIEVFPGVEAESARAHAWVTFWVDRAVECDRAQLLREVQALWPEAELPDSAVLQWRIKSKGLMDCEPLWGEAPLGNWITQEDDLRLITRFSGVKHAGIFLDHAPLRAWLRTHARGLRVLNTFAYTGSLSVAAQRGGAAQVCTVDLSRATVDWARENAELNAGFPGATPMEQMEFWAADVLEWLPRTAKRITSGKRPAFDAVILDPPSFSRSKSGTFSTEKDSVRLHQLALDVLKPGGSLITSVNSEFLSQAEFEAQVAQAARESGRVLHRVQKLAAPAPFPPTQIKGAIFRSSGSSAVNS